MKAKGFTLLELLICFTLVTVITLISISSASELVKKNESMRILDELKAAVHYAKLQAVNQGAILVLEALDLEWNWAQGMVLKKGDAIVHQWQWKHSNWQLRWIGVSGEHLVKLSSSPLQAMSNGRFVLTQNNGKREWSVVLNKLGRLRVEKE